MCRKLILLISFVAIVAMATNALAVDATWDGGAGDGLWSSPLNWDADAVPDGIAVIDSNVAGLATNPDVTLDTNASLGQLQMSAFDVNSTVDFLINGKAFSLDDGTDDGGLIINRDPNTFGTVTVDINDSSVSLGDSPDTVRLAVNSEGSAAEGGGTTVLNILNNSSVELDYLRVAGGDFTFNMDDSIVRFTPLTDTDNYIARGGGHTVINWSNSTVIQDGDPDHYVGPYKWDTDEGETDPELRGYDANTIVELNIDNCSFFWRGRWYFHDTAKEVHFNFTNSEIYANKFLIRQSTGKDFLNIQNSRIITSSYHRYSEKNPTGNEGTWGDVKYSVMRGSDVTWRERSNPGHINFEFSYIYTEGDDVDTLQDCIDTGKYVSFDGNGVWGGPVFVPYYQAGGVEGFTVLSAIPDANYAWGYWPHDGQPEGMPMPTKLMWFPAADANQQKIYASEDRQAVEDMNDALALEGTVAGDANSWTITQFQQPQQTWYWRLVEVDSAGNETAGPIIKFTTPEGKAILPVPKNAEHAAGVSPAGSVTWTTGGPWVEHHDVYLGTDEAAVEAADTNTVGIYQGTVDTNSFDLGLLTLGQTYYWRVDEKGGAFFVKGDVWSFTMANYYLIESFETYADTPELYGTWTDYHIDGDNGAAVVLSTAYNHSGAKSMELNYDDDWYAYSETERTFGSAQDWTVGDVKALTLYFYGAATNVVDQPYVKLTSNPGHT